MGIKQDFLAGFDSDEFGVITGTAGSTQFPNIGCGMVRFKADAANSGIFSIGSNSGTAAAYLPWPFSAGDDSGWIATTNLNRYWYKTPSGSMARISYWLQR